MFSSLCLFLSLVSKIRVPPKSSRFGLCFTSMAFLPCILKKDSCTYASNNPRKYLIPYHNKGLYIHQCVCLFYYILVMILKLDSLSLRPEPNIWLMYKYVFVEKTNLKLMLDSSFRY